MFFFFSTKKYWCFYPHRLRALVSPVCGICFLFVCFFCIPYNVTKHTCNLSQTLHGYNVNIFFLPKNSVNYDKLCFSTKQRKRCFNILNIHNHGYITLNKYIIGIAIVGLPKVNLWATKCVTKRP